VTTIFEEEVTCAVCGSEQTVQEMGSTSSFGPMDLDTRPPPMQRGTMEMWVHAQGVGLPVPAAKDTQRARPCVLALGVPPRDGHCQRYRKAHVAGAERSAMPSSSRLAGRDVGAHTAAEVETARGARSTVH
jgi:hypothetical protein